MGFYKLASVAILSKNLPEMKDQRGLALNTALMRPAPCFSAASYNMVVLPFVLQKTLLRFLFRKYRFVAYWQFIRCMWGRLGVCQEDKKYLPLSIVHWLSVSSSGLCTSGLLRSVYCLFHRCMPRTSPFGSHGCKNREPTLGAMVNHSYINGHRFYHFVSISETTALKFQRKESQACISTFFC